MFDEELPTPLSDAADNQDKDDGDDDVYGDDHDDVGIVFCSKRKLNKNKQTNKDSS